MCSRTRATDTKGLGFPSTMPPSSSVSAQAAESCSTPGRTNVNASSCPIRCLNNNEGRGLLGCGGRMRVIRSPGGRRSHSLPPHTQPPIRETLVCARRLRRFRLAAGIWPLALGDNLSSAACDNAPLKNQADARYFAFSRSNMLPLRISFNCLVGRTSEASTMKFKSRILEGERR